MKNLATASFIDVQKDLLEEGSIEIEENVKMICYKLDEDFFETIDFNDKKAFVEPILFSIFNQEKINIEDVYAYLIGYQKAGSLKNGTIRTNHQGQFYLPIIGWFQTNAIQEELTIGFNAAREIEVLNSVGSPIKYTLEAPLYVNSEEIEVYKYSIEPFKNSYYDEYKNILPVEVENVTKVFFSSLKNAYQLIKKYAPAHYELIQKYANKCVIFEETTGKRNSFANFAAHGVGFYNAYQEEYNEVFFIDDIAHQTGHVLMNTMARDIRKFIKIDPATIVEDIYYQGEVVETRHIEVVFHALYTYYTTFICLDACLQNDVFTGLQKSEALGRMKFYLYKCYKDLALFKKLKINFTEKESAIFTERGHVILNTIFNTWDEMRKTWGTVVKDLNMDNQPYNFTNKIFYEENNLL